MRCPDCGFANHAGARFCGSCGGQLALLCPNCGAGLTPGLRFCTACGHTLPKAAGDEPPPAGPRGPVAERRLVSVLFCDLVGFTALAEQLDPEEVRELLARYFEESRSVVARHGGTLEKFIGDAVMAVWGAPIAHEGDAERAVTAALELVGTVARLGGAAADRGLSARAAVATGEAAVTLGAVGQGMVAGDLVNTAARLQSAAGPGEVLVTDATRGVIGSTFELKAAGNHRLKGKSRPVRAWHALGTRASMSAEASTVDGPSFVDREAELRMLTEAYHGVAADGRCRLVSIVGESGVGKGRLVGALMAYLDALPDVVHGHRGRPPAYGDGPPFAPLAEMVRARLRISEGEEREIALRRLSAGLAEFVRDDAERAWLEPRLATLLVPDESGEYVREELFAAWRRFFEHVAERAPAILVFEDLQRADDGVLDFVEHVAGWSRDRPILIITLARPELLARRPTWGSMVRAYTALHLDPLPPEAMAELLEGLAHDLEPPMRRAVLKRAEGMPLYAVEMVRMLRDREADGIAAATDARTLPPSLQGLIGARIDALGSEERGLLLAAAVLGRRFRPDALLAVSGDDPGAIREATATLISRGMLVVDDEPRSPGRGQLSFSQELVRDVAYRTLSRHERRALHLAAARHLAGVDDDELIEATASHLVAAHEADPAADDADVVASAASAALMRAAQRAVAVHAPDRALTHLERAIEICRSPIETMALREEAAAAARSAARFELAESHLRQLLADAERESDLALRARAGARLVSLLLMTQRNDDAMAELALALGEGPSHPKDPASIELAGELARAHMLRGSHADAVDWAGRALAGAERLGLRRIGMEALVTRGTARMLLGEPRGIEDVRRAIDEAGTAGMLATELRARNNLAWLLITDDPAATLDEARRGMELAKELGMRDWMLQLADVVGAAGVDTGHWDLAVETLAGLEEEPMATSTRIDFAVTLCVLRALRGEVPADAPLAALEPFDPATDAQTLAVVHQARGWVAFCDSRFDEARKLAEAGAVGAVDVFLHDALVLAARAAIWAGDADARAAIARAEAAPARGRVIDAVRLSLRAALAARDGAADASALQQEASDRLRQLGLPMQLALCLIERGRFGGGAASVNEELTTLLDGLRAEGLRRLAVTGQATGQATPSGAGG
ncbi:MAG: adenylate/guanylate cyclase domain-containing protein [Candidatus Limnocylindria bacterium]